MAGLKDVVGGGGLLASLLLIAVLCYTATNRTSLFDPDYSPLHQNVNVKAIGDTGCLGSSCELSDKAAQKDLNNFFTKFLDHGSHAGRLPRRSAVAHKQLNDVAANSDMANYYDNLSRSVRKTPSVVMSEMKPRHNQKISSDEDRKQFDSYFHQLSQKVGKSPKVLQAEKLAESKAEKDHIESLQESKKSAEKIQKLHAESKYIAQLDKKLIREDQLHSHDQKAGLIMNSIAAPHSIKGVRPTVLSAAASEHDWNHYFDSLNKQVHKTPTVLAAEKRDAIKEKQHELNTKSNDLKATNLLKAWTKQQAVPSKHLSSSQAESTMESYFKSLNNEVNKSPKVERAETRSKQDIERLRDVIRKNNQKSQRSRLLWERREAVPHGHLSAEEAKKEGNKYFQSLNMMVHKTPVVVHAEQEAKLEHEENLQAEARMRVQEERQAKELQKQVAVPSIHLSAKEAKKEAESYFDSLSSQVHKTVKVLAAEQNAKKEAQQEQGRESSRGKMMAEAEKIVDSTHLPSETGQLKLKWQGNEPAGQLYRQLRNKVLRVNGREGSQVKVDSEWRSKRLPLEREYVREYA